MERTEQEQLANLISQTVSQTVTTAIQEIWQQERSLLVSLLIEEVNSHLTQTLKTYFEEQLATQRQELELELQTKIDDLKFQHYQQLERLGKAVEQVITSDFSELDDDRQEVETEDLEAIDLELSEMESDLFLDVSEEDDGDMELSLFADTQEAFRNDIPDLVDSHQSEIKTDNEFSSADQQTSELEDLENNPFMEQSQADLSLDEQDLNLGDRDAVIDALNDLFSLETNTSEPLEQAFSEIREQPEAEDDDLNLFAESATLDILSQNETEQIYLSTSDLGIEETNPFADTSLDENLDLWNDLNLNRDRFAEQSDHSPEIVYEPEEEQFLSFSLTDELEENEALSEADRLNQELERELDKVSTPVKPLGLTEIPEIQEIQDEELSEFADLETETDFWLHNNSPDLNAIDSISDALATDIWHLGIDFGYSAMRACLFNQVTQQIYPLAWAGTDFISTDISANFSIDIKSPKRDSPQISLQGLRQFLRLGLPFQVQQTWQPQVLWTNQYPLSLKDILVSYQELFAQIRTASHPELEEISEILAKIETVILGHPHEWSDAYILNLREIVLASGLVSSSNRVLVIDQAIACLFPIQEQLRQLSINSGAFSTTISFTGARQRRLEALEYAGLGINQDILLELLYAKTKDKFPATKFITSGIPNPDSRTQFQRFLLNSAIGLEALAIAEEIKLWFSQQPESQSWQGNLGGKPIMIQRSDWEIKVIQPFIQSMNATVDKLIGSTLPEDITSIAISGGTTQLPAVREWLESKFANAEVQELPSSSLAQGLAIAPLHFQFLDISPETNLEINRHQYSDYFLLSEICALNLQEPLSIGELIKKLQNRGVNAKACSDRLSKILSGQLPTGILPWLEPEKSLIAPPPQIDPLNPQILTGRLFTTVGGDLYAPNPEYTQILGSYLKILESSSHQSFSEPLVFPSFAIV